MQMWQLPVTSMVACDVGYACRRYLAMLLRWRVMMCRWMAPESYFDSTWDLRSDVWMFGVLLWGG